MWWILTNASWKTRSVRTGISPACLSRFILERNEVLGYKAKGNSVKKYGGVPWKHIKGMRDKIGHGYGTLDLDKIWDTALQDIKPLNEYCKEILSKDA